MGIERIMQHECKVCGRRIEVTSTGDVYEEPVYCCSLEASAISAVSAPQAAVAVKKKPTKKKAVKKAAKKSAEKRVAKKPAKKAVKKKAAKKKATKKKSAKKKATKKTAGKRR